MYNVYIKQNKFQGNKKKGTPFKRLKTFLVSFLSHASFVSFFSFKFIRICANTYNLMQKKREKKHPRQKPKKKEKEKSATFKKITKIGNIYGARPTYFLLFFKKYAFFFLTTKI